MMKLQGRRAVAIVAVFLAAGACQRGSGSGAAAAASPVPTDRAPFVGSIREVRDGAMLWLEEESPQRSRRGNIWLSPSTEIVTRGGQIVPAINLKRGMRATVWFRGAIDATTSAVSGTARRIVVDY